MRTIKPNEDNDLKWRQGLNIPEKPKTDEDDSLTESFGNNEDVIEYFTE